MKMIAIVMIPIVVLLGLTTNIFATKINNHLQVSSLRQIVVFSVELGDVLHNLQRERDMSALYVSDIAPEQSKNFLIQRYPLSDRSLMNMSFWPADNKLADTRAEFTTKEKFMNYLNRHRYGVYVS